MIQTVSNYSRQSNNSRREKTAVICASKISKSFGGNQVIREVTFELKRGQVVLLQGSNGSGKTTLLNILTGHLEADQGEIIYSVTGSNCRIKFPLNWWQQAGIRRKFAPEEIALLKLGRTWQDVRLFSSLNLGENTAVAAQTQIGESLIKSIFHLKKATLEEKNNMILAEQRLVQLGLGDRIHSSADKISMGQMKRVAIARALHTGAKVLFLDEPLFGLDAPGIRSVVKYLKQLADDPSMTLIIIEHSFNIRHIKNIINTVWTLDDGTLNIHKPEEIKKLIMSLDDHFAEKVFQEAYGKIDKLSIWQLPGGARLLSSQLREESSDTPVLEIKDLVVHRGNRLVIGWPEKAEESQTKSKKIAGLSFKILRGALVLLQAPNGWGKTTLLEAIAGLIPVSSGEIFLEGNPLTGMAPWKRRSTGLAFLQARNNTFPNLKVPEMLQLASIGEIPEILKPFSDRYGGELSGGERQILAISMAILNSNFSVCLLDELFSNLDASKIKWTFDLIRRKIEQQGVFLALPR